jgi:hypothetical protein
MKTRFLIIIGIVSIVILGIIIPNYWLEFDDYSIFLCERWFDSHYQCNAIWIDPQCNLPGDGCIFPEKSPLEKFLEKKAIAAFNLKLDDYRIISKVHAAYPAYSTGLHKSFVTQAVTVNGSDVTRYYLSTSFIPDESLDEINVQIYKIISEKCDLSIISAGSDCESKYLEIVEPKPRSSLDGWIAGISDSDSTLDPPVEPDTGEFRYGIQECNYIDTSGEKNSCVVEGWTKPASELNCKEICKPEGIKK